jgi:hypothetical protein
MKNKKVIIAAILTVMAIASLIYGITTPSGNARPRSLPAKGRSVSAAEEEAGARIDSLFARRRAARTKYRTWKRNAFISKDTSGSSSGLVLNGILGSGPGAKAMIGDNIVKVGDIVGGNKVVEIRPKKVILNDGEKNFELTMD